MYLFVYHFSDAIKEAWDEKKTVDRNMREMGLSADPNKTIPVPKAKVIMGNSFSTIFWPSFMCLNTLWPSNAIFVKLYSSTSAQNSILAGAQYIFTQKNLRQHLPLLVSN